MAKMTVQQAIDYVARNGAPDVDEMLELPAWQLIATTLFEIANSPNVKQRGSLVASRTAQKLIADRLVGTRRPGTEPVTAGHGGVSFVDLTLGELE